MRRFVNLVALSAALTMILVLPPGLVSGQVGQAQLAACREMAFSTEEDFITQGPEPPDGNPIISDGDLLGPNCQVCARNLDLVQGFGVTMDLGLDAVDVIDVETYLVAFSTELDSPEQGQFTAGDLLATNGTIIPNTTLLAQFDMQPADLGLDALHFVGNGQNIVSFLDEVKSLRREYWVDNPGSLASMLRQYSIDIWFSTEGTGPGVELPLFLDGDLLSALDGTIVAANSALLPASVPAGIPNQGVDFGLDAVTANRAGDMELIHFSTSILYRKDPSFTDGDVLRYGNGVVHTNHDLINCFEPKADFLGLDAFSIPEVPRPPCGAAIIRVGGMAVGSIGSNGLADGPSASTPLFEAQDSPFGGWVEIIGLMPSCEDCEEFKVEYGEWPSVSTPPTTWLPLTDDFQEWKFIWPSWYVLVDREPDANGWLSILCETTMGGLYFPWNTAGKDGKHSLRLTVKDTGGTEHVSAPVEVILDNTAPDATLSVASSPVCGDIFAGDIVTGTVTATDQHFYSYRLRYESSLASGLIIDPVRKYTGVADQGDTNAAFSWNTTGLPACGYRIILEVWDRSIVHNKRSYGEPGFGWRTIDQAYFCLEAAEP
jgi:hypothetical protein